VYAGRSLRVRRTILPQRAVEDLLMPSAHLDYGYTAGQDKGSRCIGETWSTHRLVREVSDIPAGL